MSLVVTGIFETKAYMMLHSRGILPVKALARVQWQTEQDDDDVTKQLLLIYDKVSRSIMDAAFLRCDITLSWKRKISLEWVLRTLCPAAPEGNSWVVQVCIHTDIKYVSIYTHWPLYYILPASTRYIKSLTQ